MLNGAAESTGSSPWQQLQELASDAARLQTDLARGYAAAARAATRGDGQTARQLLKTAGTEFENYLRELGRLNLAYARAFQDLALASSERLQEVVDGEPARRRTQSGRTVVRRSGPTHGSAGPPRAALALEAPVGGRAAGSFTVANTREETVDLSFDAGLLFDASEGSSATAGFAAPFIFEPTALQLAPGTESTVSVALAMQSALFTAGRDYQGEVRVVGGDGAVFDVTVRASPAEPAKAVATAAVPNKPPAAVPRKRPAAAKTARSSKKAAAKRPARGRRTPPGPT